MLVVDAQPDRLTPDLTRALVQPPPRPPTHLPREPREHGSVRDARRARGHVSLGGRLVAVGLLLLVAAAVAVTVVLAGSGASNPRHQGTRAAPSRAAVVRAAAPARPQPSSFAVGLRVLRLVDSSRTITLADGSIEPCSLLTYV